MKFHNVHLTILLLSLLSTQFSYGEDKCADLFLRNQASIQIEDTVNAKTYLANKTKATDKAWDIATLGVLAELYDLKSNLKNRRNLTIFNPSMRPSVEARTKALLSMSEIKITSQHLDIINRTVNIENLTEDTVLVSLKNFSIGKMDPELDSAIKHYFSMTYTKLVNWVYRLHNLEKNETLSSMVMMDEVSSYARQQIGFEFNLIYDKKVFAKHLQVIAKVIEDYQAANDPPSKAQILQRLQIEIPLMPIGGVIVASKITDANAPVELKRYFKNEFEDPLGILELKAKDEFKLRHAMLYKAIQRLPKGQLVEIHAHTKAHVIAYAKIGFIDVGKIVNPKYPEIEIHLLRATREEALKHLKTILDELE